MPLTSASATSAAGPVIQKSRTEAFGPVLNAKVCWFEDDAERVSDTFLKRIVVKASEQQSVAEEFARLALLRHEIVLKFGNPREYLLPARQSEVSGACLHLSARQSTSLSYPAGGQRAVGSGAEDVLRWAHDDKRHERRRR